MQPGSLTRSDVESFYSRVLVNGIERPVISWSVDRELGADLPAGVAGGTGITQATGNVEWALVDVADASLNPWNVSTGWIPHEGDRVEIYAGDGVTEWKQFTGVIDSSSGSVGGGLNSKIIDRIDDFSVRANLPSLVDVMPPVDVGGTWRRFRLTPMWAAMISLRRAGFYATPAPEPETAIDVPGFGGMWPYSGSMISCHRNSDQAQAPLTPYSTHIADVYARYEPSSPKAGGQPVQLTMRVAAQHAGVASVMAMYGTAYLTLRATASTVIFMVNGVTIASLPRSGAVVVQAYFANKTVRLRTSSGGDVTATGTWQVVSTMMSEVRVIADANSVVNGFIVSHPTAEQAFRNIAWVPTANIVNGNMHAAMAGLHNSKDKSVREVLDEIASSILWPYWIDEYGVVQMIASDMLRNGQSRITLTTLDDIRELSWSRDLLGVRNRVITTFERATVNRRSDYSLPVWESSESVVLQSNEEHSIIIDPGSEEWLMVDGAWKTMAQFPLLNKGIGTWLGGVYTDGQTDEWTNVEGQGTQVDYSFQGVSGGVWKFTAKARTLAPGKQVELRSVRGEFVGVTALWPFWWDKNLPIVRAKGKFVTDEAVRPAVIAAGKGANLEHNTGLWATGNNEADEMVVIDRITTFLAEQTKNPHPTITDLRVGYEPRLQIGDVITVLSESFLGVKLTCLVTAKTVSGGNDGYAMSLGVRVIDVEQTFTTWAEWENAWGPTANYVALEAAWPDESNYADFNEDPLRGTE